MKRTFIISLLLAMAVSTMARVASGTTELARVRNLAKALVESRVPGDVAVGKKSQSASDANGFVVLTDVIPDAVIELRYYSEYNFVGTRVDGYEQPVALCTREAAAALKKVAAELRAKGYLLKIYDAYRPQKAVDHFVRWAKSSSTKMKSFFYPEITDKKTLFPMYIATKSGHTKGSTFDLTIVDAKTGEEVDMGGTFDYFGNRSHYAFKGITAQQKANRKILHDAMVKGGFTPLAEEWWHFTLKNQPYPNTYFTFPVSLTEIK